jgi:RNA polymerase sigma factor (sigma-70 family)
MAESLPPELAHLLGAPDDLSRERAWTVFLNTFSPLILHAARSAATGYDEGMDAYAAALDGLRADDYRKLRGYSVDPRSRFTTWLVVVVRRICIDKQRERFGRTSSKEREAHAISDERAARRRLAMLTASSLELESIPDSHGAEPDLTAQQRELNELLETALLELDERDRLLLTLRFVDDLPAKRIAVLQGWPDHMSVYRRISQITASLKQKLLARGVDTSVP